MAANIATPVFACRFSSSKFFWSLQNTLCEFYIVFVYNHNSTRYTSTVNDRALTSFCRPKRMILKVSTLRTGCQNSGRLQRKGETSQGPHTSGRSSHLSSMVEIRKTINSSIGREGQTTCTEDK